MEIRRPLEWHCKQMDHFVGLNFSANFNFALVGHLLKGKANRMTGCTSSYKSHGVYREGIMTISALSGHLAVHWSSQAELSTFGSL